MTARLPPRIAIPMPHSGDPGYSERAIPQYERAVKLAGGEPVRIRLDQTPAEVLEIAASCDAVLLPGSNADIDPARFGAIRSPHTAAADPRRDAVDELLLRDAYHLRKPVLGICYGLQSLNVYRTGSLIQHIPDFLPEELRTRVDHEAGKSVAVAHQVELEKDSILAGIVHGENRESPRFSPAGKTPGGNADSAVEGGKLLAVNSSHHQSADAIGEGLRIVARCTADGIIEALEGTAPNHFVLAVQWHPERSVDDDEPSRTIFEALVKSAEARRKQVKIQLENVK